MAQMQEIITELTQLTQVLESQLTNPSTNSPCDYDKQQLLYQNMKLEEQIEALKIEKDKIKV